MPNRIPGTVVVLSLLGMGWYALASGTSAAWTTQRIESLFPDPISGWKISALMLEEVEPAPNEFESVAGSLVPDSDHGVRLRALRHYESEGKRITMVIDTKDIEAAVQVEGIVAGYKADRDLRERIKASGMSIVDRQGFAGLISRSGQSAGWAFKIGSAAVVLLECHYERCATDLAAVAGVLDLKAIEIFVGFSHRRREESEADPTTKHVQTVERLPASI